jgi:DNA-binding beta-propeller fold protein YncE
MNRRAAHDDNSAPSGAVSPGGPGSCTARLVLSHVSERSVLHDPNLQPFTVAGRNRLATCSGVAWFRGHHLAVVNLYGGHLRVYSFHPGRDGSATRPRLELLHEMTEGLSYPEDVAVSPDGNLLAVTHSMSDDLGVSLHPIDAVSLAPRQAGETLRRGSRGSAFHGVSFSSDSRHLAFTEIGAPGYVEVVSVATPRRERTCLLENRRAPMKPKSVAFSRDGRFVVIAMAPNAARVPGGAASDGSLSVHSFDAASGVIGAALAETHGADIVLGNMEICTFLPTVSGSPYRILVANQGADMVTAFTFDPGGRTLAFTGIFAAGLPFPHGVDACADGRFVAVTTYGDDSVHIARVTPGLGGASGRSTP